MTQIPNQPGDWPGASGELDYVHGSRTSRTAIASLVCGVLSVGTCCTFLPGILALSFGIGALPAIRRHETHGFGLAVSGIVLGVLGLILGIVVWVLFAASPDATPIPGHELAATDRAILEQLKVVDSQEPIELFYSDGLLSIREGGIVLTQDRVITYGETGELRSLPLESVSAISFTPGTNWWGTGNFILEGDDGQLLSFVINTWDGDDQRFNRILRQLVTKARDAAGKAPVRSQLSSEAADPNA